ncbi:MULTISPECIES: hypothetical protein [Rhodococcus]|uniref:hypothetical protein n=1 Tax=Rhodococcus TaxID=1827 RepID=UPI0012E96836|nr:MULTISPECIES: hypothetical protein [Rhodococcus]WAL49567.1 hypothetical protein OQN32_27580 [Rhodococcus pyridinivorans]
MEGTHGSVDAVIERSKHLVYWSHRFGMGLRGLVDGIDDVLATRIGDCLTHLGVGVLDDLRYVGDGLDGGGANRIRCENRCLLFDVLLDLDRIGIGQLRKLGGDEFLVGGFATADRRTDEGTSRCTDGDTDRTAESRSCCSSGSRTDRYTRHGRDNRRVREDRLRDHGPIGGAECSARCTTRHRSGCTYDCSADQTAGDHGCGHSISSIVVNTDRTPERGRVGFPTRGCVVGALEDIVGHPVRLFRNAIANTEHLLALLVDRSFDRRDRFDRDRGAELLLIQRR